MTPGGPTFNADAAAKFFPNSQKYRDQGAKPATGRSGSAVIESRALLGKDGVTLVEATTGVLDDGATPPGTIVKVQTKIFAPDESMSPATNEKDPDGGYYSASYAGLYRNGTIQLQSSVRGIDGDRTDVVTTKSTIKLRPDLGAQSLSGPARAYTNARVAFVALVAELNTDVGARANCVLSVDGAEVDRAQGIWVDAGSAVSCAFSTRFTTTGTKSVRVDVTGVTPGDWDDANNAATTTIEVVDPTVPLNYYAEAIRQAIDRSYRLSEWRWDGSTRSYELDGFWDNTSAYVVGWTPAALLVDADNNPQSLAAVSFSVSRDGSVIRSFTATDLPSAYEEYDEQQQWCTEAYAEGYGIWACTYDWDGNGPGEKITYITGTVYGGAVTYHARDSRTSASGDTWSYNYDDSYEEGVGAFELGTSVTLELKVTDAMGTTYVATPEISVSSEPLNHASSFCSLDFWGYGYCVSDTWTGTRWRGFAERNE